jgi:hypothetical protein
MPETDCIPVVDYYPPKIQVIDGRLLYKVIVSNPEFSFYRWINYMRDKYNLRDGLDLWVTSEDVYLSVDAALKLATDDEFTSD